MAAAAILDIKKLLPFVSLFDRSSPKVVETLGLTFGTYRGRRKCKVAQIEERCRRHLEFRNTVAISVLIDRSSPN